MGKRMAPPSLWRLGWPVIGRFVRTWWWPLYVFLYPLLFIPGQHDYGPAFKVRSYVTVVFLAVGLALELLDPASRSRRLRPTIVEGLNRHPLIVIALLFGGWVVMTSLLAPNPAIALTGAFVSLADGAVWMLAMIGVFILVYVRTVRNSEVIRYVAWAIAASGIILAVGAAVEVVAGRGLVYPFPHNALPAVTFPQKGHLAGMLALSGGVAAGLWPGAAFSFLVFSVGLTLNRSAGIAVMTAKLLHLLITRARPSRVVRAVVLAALALLAGYLASRAFVPSPKATDVVSGSTLVSRSFYYRAALRAIAQRPLRGWGGGNFALVWPDFLSSQELDRFGRLEWGYQQVLGAQVSETSPPLLAVRDAAGGYQLTLVRTFKAHDQLLEIVLMWGIPGALLYLLLVGSALRGLRRGSPLAVGILAYAIFLLLWFVIPETQGVWWVMLAAAGVEARLARPRSGRVPT